MKYRVRNKDHEDWSKEFKKRKDAEEWIASRNFPFLLYIEEINEKG